MGCGKNYTQGGANEFELMNSRDKANRCSNSGSSRRKEHHGRDVTAVASPVEKKKNIFVVELGFILINDAA
jgi:hypothetical protein